MGKKGGDICARLAEVRRKHFGPRGKARFARELGIQPSTYQHYEIDRTAPAELLAVAAQVTGTDIQWLLTGEGERNAASPPPESNVTHLPLVQRLMRLLEQKPALSQSVEGFLDLLEGVAGTFPELPDGRAGFPEAGSVGPDEPDRRSDLIPVIGSTAAGPARYWQELDERTGEFESEARLDELLNQSPRGQPPSPRAIRQAELVTVVEDFERSRFVSLVQWSRPDEIGFIEFLCCPAAKTKYPKAVAWRIDGESMAPRYRDGDLVITSPDQPAVEGHPCIAHQQGQIGVNCKLFHRDEQGILLIPVNEPFDSQRVKPEELLWAHRVLYSVRLSGRS